MGKRLLVISPCLISPYTVYRGAKPAEIELAGRIRRLLAAAAGLEVLLYPCPEFFLLGFPRPPAPREVYERLGIREVTAKVAEFIVRVTEEAAPEHLVVAGVKGSPTCGVYTTTRGAPDAFPYETLDSFPRLPREERFSLAKELAARFREAEGPGVLMESLRRNLPTAEFLELDKHAPEEGLKRLQQTISPAA